MPPRVPWMTTTDRFILELLDQVGIAVPPKVIWINLRCIHGEETPSQRHIRRRLRNELSEYGLVHQPFPDEARGLYALTELGDRFFHDPDANPEEFIDPTNEG